MADSESHQFSNISTGNKPGSAAGVLKLSPGGLGWKAKTGRSVAIARTDIDNVIWVPTGKLNQLRVVVTGGSVVKFDGFRSADRDGIEAFIKKYFDITTESLALSTNGWNWGDAVFENSVLAFKTENKPAFELPLTEVSQAVVQKNEIALEFHRDEASKNDKVDTLLEIRLSVPSSYKGFKRAGVEAAPEDEADTVAPIQILHQHVLAKADVVMNTGHGLVTFEQTAVVVPRGRYDLELFSKFFKMHGKTYDYKINYSSIYHLALLPKNDERYIAFVISLDPPIRQGHTTYPHLVFQFLLTDSTEVNVNRDGDDNDFLKDRLSKLTDEEMLDGDTLTGNTYQVIEEVFRAFTGKKIQQPNNYYSVNQGRSVKCSLKASDGFLFPLDKSFVFVNKPATYVPFSEVSVVEFSRVNQGSTASANRNFDLVISTRGGIDYQFTNIQKNEYSNLYQFLHNRVKIKGTKQTVSSGGGRGGGGDKALLDLIGGDEDMASDEEDDDFDEGDGSDDDDLEYDSGGASDNDSGGDLSGSDGEGEGPRKKKSAPKKKAAPKGKGKAKAKSKDDDRINPDDLDDSSDEEDAKVDTKKRKSSPAKQQPKKKAKKESEDEEESSDEDYE